MTEFLPDTKLEVIHEALYVPVPDMTHLRELKKGGYAHVPIDTTDPRYNEPVVSVRDYGIAGQAFYSRPNPATGGAVPGVPPIPMLRQSMAEKLAMINNNLDHPAIEEVFDGAVELYIQDSLRPISLQTYLHDEAFPALLRKNHPNITDEELTARISDLIAVGSADPLRPSPHATGGPVDVVLRYIRGNIGWVEGSLVQMGHNQGETSSRVNPDYFEWQEPITPEDEMFRRHRRAFNAIMTGAAFGTNTGLVVNPTEFWHWGEGDQLSTLVAGREKAFYSIPPVE